MILPSKPNSGEYHGREQRTSAQKRISNQMPKEEINKTDKDLRANAQWRHQLQWKSVKINYQLNVE